MRRFGNPESIRDRQAGMTFGVYLESVHKVMFFVIPAEAGIQNLLKTMDSGLRTAGMAESKLIDSLKKCHSRESVLRPSVLKTDDGSAKDTTELQHPLHLQCRLQ